MTEENQDAHRETMCNMAKRQGYTDGQRGDSIDPPHDSLTIKGVVTKFYAPKDELRAYLHGYLEGVKISKVADDTRKRLEEEARLQLSGFKPTSEV